MNASSGSLLVWCLGRAWTPTSPPCLPRNSRRGEKGCVGGLACQAPWTLARAIEAGYRPEDDRCPVCRAVRDILFHRLWKCSAVTSGRAAVLGDLKYVPGLESELSAQDLVLYATCVSAHPGGYFPPPSEQLPVARHADGPGCLGTKMQGAIFTDGSFVRHAGRELSRSGWAHVRLCV
eukprot:6983786-Pyramimonas_sp.AAC.1